MRPISARSRAAVGDRIENDDPTRSDRDIRDWSAARRLGSPNLNAVSSFDQLIADIEQEAHDEGSQAVRDLEQFREEFRVRQRTPRDPERSARRSRGRWFFLSSTTCYRGQ